MVSMALLDLRLAKKIQDLQKSRIWKCLFDIFQCGQYVE